MKHVNKWILKKTIKSNRLIYNPQYSEVRANEPYILSNTSSINTSSYQMPLRDHSSPLGGHRSNYDSRGNPNFESNSRHDSTFGSRRNSLGYRSVRSQKAITARYCTFPTLLYFDLFWPFWRGSTWQSLRCTQNIFQHAKSLWGTTRVNIEIDHSGWFGYCRTWQCRWFRY